MIRLYIGFTELDIPPELQFKQVIETSAFDREKGAKEFSYPIDLPLTDKNRIALGKPENISNSKTPKKFDAKLSVSGFETKVLIYLLSVSDGHNTVSITIVGNYGGYWNDVANKTLRDLYYDGVRIIGAIDSGNERSDFLDRFNSELVRLYYTPCTSASHINDVINGNITTDYVFHQAIDEKLNIPFLHDEQNYLYPEYDQLITTGRNRINAYYYNNAGDKGIIDPVKEYIETTFYHVKKRTNDRYFWVPFFRLHYVIEKCFTELGYSVSGSILSDADFRQIALHNTYAINRCVVNENKVGTDGYAFYIYHHGYLIDPRNHVPDMPITEFLSEVGKAFNLQYKIDYTNKEVVINNYGFNASNFNNIVDITNITKPKPRIQLEQNEAAVKGYHLQFEFDDNNSASSENHIGDINGYTYRGHQPIYASLYNIANPNNEELGYVLAENAYYQYLNAKWNFFGFDFREFKTSENNDLQVVRTKVNPMPSKRFFQLCRMKYPGYLIFQDPNFEVTYDEDMLMPFSAMGMEGKSLLAIQRNPKNVMTAPAEDEYKGAIKTVDATVKHTQPHICNHLGLASVYPGSGAVYPSGNNNIYDGNGDIKTGHYLFWNNTVDVGLYTFFWRQFIDNVFDSIIIEAETKWTISELINIDLHSQLVRYNSQLFICKKAEIMMPLPNYAKLELVKIH